MDKYLDGAILDEVFKTKDSDLKIELNKLKLDKGQLNKYEKDTQKFIQFEIMLSKIREYV